MGNKIGQTVVIKREWGIKLVKQ